MTNDAFAPLRAPRLRSVPRASERRGRRFAARRARHRPGRAGPLVAHHAAVRERPAGGPAASRPGRADAGALRDRHAGDGPRRGGPRRLRHPVRRAVQPGDARHGAARVLRRGAGRRPVRAPRGRRAAALSAPAPKTATWCWRRPTPPTPTAPGWRGRSATAPGAGGRAARPAPTCCSGTASRCSSSSAADAASCGSPSWMGCARRGARVLAEAARTDASQARDRAPRRRAGDRLGPRGDADRGRLLAPATAPRRVGVAAGTLLDP